MLIVYVPYSESPRLHPGPVEDAPILRACGVVSLSVDKYHAVVSILPIIHLISSSLRRGGERSSSNKIVNEKTEGSVSLVQSEVKKVTKCWYG